MRIAAFVLAGTPKDPAVAEAEEDREWPSLHGFARRFNPIGVPHGRPSCVIRYFLGPWCSLVIGAVQRRNRPRGRLVITCIVDSCERKRDRMYIVAFVVIVVSSKADIQTGKQTAAGRGRQAQGSSEVLIRAQKP